MKTILLMCSAGMSTSMLVKKMKEAVEQQNAEVQIKAIAEPMLEENIADTDIILLGPQIRYLQSKVEDVAKGIPVRVIDMMDYGAMNGAKILKFALDIIDGKKS